MAVLAAFLLVLVALCLAFAIDVGYICLVRTQAQAAADSAALAGGQELVSEDRLRGAFEAAYENARSVAAQFAAQNRVARRDAYLDAQQDIQVGRLDDPKDRSVTLDPTDPSAFNALTVTVRATRDRGRQAPLFFGRLFGRREFDMQATATVAFADRIAGFRTPRNRPEAATSLLPFTLRAADWRALLEHGGNDEFAYDPETNAVTAGADGLPELTLFPIDQGAGNWGTVDIGNTNNSTAGLERQIRHGVSAQDFAAHGGSLELDAKSGTLTLNGDTGISAGVKDALAAIIGRPRTIPLHSAVAGNGNGLDYEIVGFAGIRIVDVKLTAQEKRLIVQPAFVVDGAAVPASGSGESYYVVQPCRLVR